MARTIRTKVYKFDELTQKAKEIAIERERTAYYQHGEPLFMFDEYCEEKANELGFYDCKFQWSLSSCQGDGLSFSGRIDNGELTKRCIPDIKPSLLKVLSDNITIEIKGNTGHYSYAATSDVDLWMDDYSNKDHSNILAIVDKLKEYLEDTYMELCKELEKDGYSWIEGESEDQAIIDRIEANEWEFTADGKMI